MNDQELVSDELLDYMSEMLNIGAGNAATALNQLLHCDVNVRIPAVEFLPTIEGASVLGDPSVPVASSRMKIVGDVTGHLFFIVPDDQKTKLAELAARAMLGSRKADPNPESVLATLGEVGNILAGVSLTAIHDFCKLNIFHSVPVLAVDRIQAVLDESIATRNRESSTMILVKIEFVIDVNQLKAFLLLIPSAGFMTAVVISMNEARKPYGHK